MLPIIKFWKRARVRQLEEEFIHLGNIVDKAILDFHNNHFLLSIYQLKKRARYSLQMIRKSWNLNYEYVDSFVLSRGYSPNYYKLEERAALLYNHAINRINRI